MVGDANSVVTNFETLDLLQVPSLAVQPEHTAANLIAYAEKAAQQGGLGIYLFHGVGSQWIAVSAAEHKKLAEYLANHKETYWVTTFDEAMNYVAQWQKTQKPAAFTK